MGCFYIESPAMRQLQAKVASGDFDRLVVHSSIIRPAANRWIAEYVRRHHHAEARGSHDPAWYPHPALQGLLSESYGVLSYQEDVMMVCQRLAGFGSREANTIRKALGRWDAPERLRALAPAFFAGCAAHQVARPVADTVWDMISSFAGYSFCKAHSASYAMVSFQCAFLKAHYPAHFLARVVANQGGFYHTSAYLEEARRLGVALRGPCVLESALATRREGAGAIRIGLHLVPGLRAEVAHAIVAARALRPFASLSELRRRCHAQHSDLLALHAAGALDALLAAATPAQRRWLVAAVGRDGAGGAGAPDAGQQTIGLAEAEAATGAGCDPPPPTLPPIAARTLMRQRCATLGFLVEAHPLTLYDLPPRRLRCGDVGADLGGRQVTLIALAITRKQVVAHSRGGAAGEEGEEAAPRRDEAMAFVTLEDESGLVETVWFPAVYRRCGVCLERAAPIRFSGRVLVEFGVVTVSVERAESLPE
jgi:DNA polymerase III alpha subunit